jgi:hypothetical protein
VFVCSAHVDHVTGDSQSAAPHARFDTGKSYTAAAPHPCSSEATAPASTATAHHTHTPTHPHTRAMSRLAVLVAVCCLAVASVPAAAKAKDVTELRIGVKVGAAAQVAAVGCAVHAANPRQPTLERVGMHSSAPALARWQSTHPRMRTHARTHARMRARTPPAQAGRVRAQDGVGRHRARALHRQAHRRHAV